MYAHARGLAADQTVFSNDSCRNLIKVIRVIPRNNINSLFIFLSLYNIIRSLHSSVSVSHVVHILLFIFFPGAPRLFVIDKLTVNIYVYA